jgi:hypothetical protein
MKFSIRTGKHHSFPPVIGIYYERRSFRKSVFFSASCRYAIEGTDMQDWNKVYGVCFASPLAILTYGGNYFLYKLRLRSKPLAPQHYNSARLASRYNPLTDRMTLAAYCYLNGEREVREICEVPLEKWVDTELYLGRDSRYFFGVNDPKDYFRTMMCQRVPYLHGEKWGFALGPYFGGNQPSPHKQTIHLKNPTQ